MTFTQLQVHSNYTLLHSPLALPDLIQAAKTRGYTAIALTDTNVVYGLVEFYRQAKAAGLKPLLGMQIDIDDARLLVIAENNTGYHQLLKLSTQIMLAKTPVKFADLLPLTGLAAIALPDSPFSEAVTTHHDEQAMAFLTALKAKQPASVYVGVDEARLDSAIPAFIAAHQLEPLALGNVLYRDPTDAFTQKVMVAIDEGSQLNFRDPVLTDAGEAWLKPPTDAAAPFAAAGLQTAVDHTADIAARADVTIDFKQPQLPHYQTPDQIPSKDYLTQLAKSGLDARFHGQPIPEAYQKRLQYELHVIIEMGFADYFLVVWDVMNYAHKVNIMTGAGRGSAAGSLVSYALAITEVDPIEYNLLFERFLNPARAQMPDIDLDIPDNRRGELIQYVHDKYGENHMAQIITFGTFGAKQAIRDVARVFGLSQFESNTWSKAIPNLFHIDLKTAYEQSQPLKNLVADSPKNRMLFQTALALEGLPRHYSTHAAGIVLSEEPLTDTVALQPSGDGLEQTQVPKDDVEALGLLKMDFLGLKNLNILAAASHFVARDSGKPFDPKTIPLDDKPTLNLFARGDTNGVFQFESSGIKNVLRKLHPTAFEDVVAVNALYRPGPMENIDTFIARKNGQEPIAYPDPALTEILKPTYGVLVYQEQVMQVANVMGGFSLGEADLLRRAMSKKKSAVLAAEQDKFIEGAVKQGFPEETAKTVYAYIDRFANYGFNRSHAVAYSKVAFWLAYLKVHYPAAFFAALMNASMNNLPKLRTYVQEAKARKVGLLGPDINASNGGFKLSQGKIRFGLSSVKGMRRDFSEAIFTARQNGPFKNLRDLLQRLDPKWLKADNFKSLILAGAFDTFDANRAQTLANLDELINSVKLAGNDVELFSMLAPKIIKVPEMSASERLEAEAEVLGVYLSGHPVDKYAPLKTQYTLASVSDLKEGQTVNILLLVRHIKRIRTKTGKPMAFVDGQDATGNVSLTVFPNLYPTIEDLTTDMVVFVNGRVEKRNDDLQLVVNRIQDAQPLLASLPSAELFIRLDAKDTTLRTDLLKKLQAAHGTTPVITVDTATRESILLDKRYWVKADTTLVEALKSQFGANNVVLRTRQES
ncbi:DNA polymerase III subunit alpha [Lacticaseibacillus casei]|uniref:DNA polymerase III subunit alpha n=1 Tax=Lacticaseibacillus casei TaxID=1582 RepID=UPI001109C821|nr:DNA polymerase III subunit alpha [Lacticaseibacillus casei]TLQ51309.1 DNA polymerase III subunit alpha [Lacticaseibacillus casei]